MDKIEDTNCFSYKVEMIIQVLAENEESARQQLDDKGGHVTIRKVRLMDSVPVYNGVKKQSTNVSCETLYVRIMAYEIRKGFSC